VCLEVVGVRVFGAARQVVEAVCVAGRRIGRLLQIRHRGRPEPRPLISGNGTIQGNDGADAAIDTRGTALPMQRARLASARADVTARRTIAVARVKDPLIGHQRHKRRRELLVAQVIEIDDEERDLLDELLLPRHPWRVNSR